MGWVVRFDTMQFVFTIFLSPLVNERCTVVKLEEGKELSDSSGTEVIAVSAPWCACPNAEYVRELCSAFET